MADGRTDKVEIASHFIGIDEFEADGRAVISRKLHIILIKSN